MKANKSVINGYVARDKSGLLYLYIEKPCKDEERWMAYGFLQIKTSMFPFIKWTDKEPTSVKITIEINE